MRFIRCAVLAGLPIGLLLTDGLTPTMAHAEPGDAKAFYIESQPRTGAITARGRRVRVRGEERLAALGEARASAQTETHTIAHGDPRPSVWCGWWLRRHLGVADRAYNLASAWARFGRPASGPAPGVIAVWRHHVGIVTAVPGPGRIVLMSGNDDHAVRERERPSAGVIAWRTP